MATVAMEECIEQIPNRFDLVLIAAGRAKALDKGITPTLPRNNDKNTVLALREIEAGNLDIGAIRDGLVTNMQRYAKVQESEEDSEEIRAVDAEIMGESILNDEDLAESDAFQVVEEV